MVLFRLMPSFPANRNSKLQEFLKKDRRHVIQFKLHELHPDVTGKMLRKTEGVETANLSWTSRVSHGLES